MHDTYCARPGLLRGFLVVNLRLSIATKTVHGSSCTRYDAVNGMLRMNGHSMRLYVQGFTMNVRLAVAFLSYWTRVMA